jgi:hypothetical protein
VKRFTISDRDTAEAIAPPSPCTPRPTMSAPCEVARPHASDASVKRVMPIRKSRLWPKRSPRRPPSSRNPPYVSRYAFTTHANEVSEKPRSSRIEGSATPTMVTSRTIIRLAAQRT